MLAAGGGAVGVQTMGKITAAQLVACFQRYVREGWGYVWGLNGQLYTQAMADKYKAERRRTSKHRDPATYWTVDCARWIGKMAADCSGGIVCAMREYNPGYGDRTADTFFNQCTESGKIKTLPEVPGLCLWRKGHIGIYEGGGYAIEFRGTDYGCVRTKVSQRNFTHWGRLRDVDYSNTNGQEDKPMDFEIRNPYLRGPAYEAMQTVLAADGYDLGKIDGIWGPKSRKAFDAFCVAHGGGTSLPDTLTVTVEAAGKTYKGKAEGA